MSLIAALFFCFILCILIGAAIIYLGIILIGVTAFKKRRRRVG